MVISDNEIIRIMKEVANRFLIPHFLELGMNASGEWVSSIEVQGSNNLGIIRGRDYTEYLVNGYKGATNVSKIYKWGVAKFGSFSISAAFAVSKKIANEGTSWYQQGGSDLLEILNSQEVNDYITGELREYMVKSVVSQIEDFAI